MPSTAERDRLVRSALEINFGLGRFFVVVTRGRAEWRAIRRRRSVLRAIIRQLEGARAIIEQSARYFRDVTDEEATRLFNTPEIPPAYAIYDQAVFFTSAFARFGPMCRAAMVLHESIHVIDSASGTPAAHISEWDEPGFANQSIDDSVHNPSAYASFGAQVHERQIEWPREARYGAGRPND